MSRLLGLTVLLSLLSTQAMAGWSDWWKTPEQQALELYESGDVEKLLKQAPDEQWQGIGQFKSGDFESASQTFDTQRQSSLDNGDSANANTSLYNRALSDIMSGQYQKAIDGLDELLDVAPDYNDAQHNRDIAQQLLELEQQQQNSEQGDEGESGESNDSDSQQSESSNGGDQSEESSEQSESEDAQNSDQSEGSEEDTSDTSDSKSDEQQQQEAQDASEALDAEAEQQQSEQETNELDENEAIQAIENDQPLSESEQATEQLLRRIPDDPRGLLRRKLEQSHRSEYPEVRDAKKPW